MQIKFCFIDTETTGLDKIKNGIIQIAGKIVIFNDGNFEQKEAFNYNVRPFPNDVVEPGALQVNKKTVEEINSYEAPEVVHNNFVQLLSKYCDKFDRRDKFFFVGYNASFDYGMMWEWFVKCGDNYFGSWFWSPAIDVMTMAALKLLDHRHTMPNFKLQNVSMFLNISPEGSLHDAMVDIDVTEKLFYKLIAEPMNILNEKIISSDEEIE